MSSDNFKERLDSLFSGESGFAIFIVKAAVATLILPFTLPLYLITKSNTIGDIVSLGIGFGLIMSVKKEEAEE